MLKHFKFASDILGLGLGGQQQQQQQQGKTSTGNFDIFLEKPFWIWDEEQHKKEFIRTNEQCCFNHIIGLPVKNNQEYPIFDYEKLIYDAIEQNQNIWIKKSRGIGVTTFVIRYLVWKILYSNDLDGKSIFIISGTREEFANYIKTKMQDLFLRRFLDLVLDSKYTELWIKKTWIKVMPTRNIKDVRGYMDTAYLFVDEADHGDPSFQQELEPAITAYEEKSKGKTILSSSPNAPGGLFERIELDKNSKYHKLFLGYQYGLDKIYDRAFIERKKLEPEFPREYEGFYLGKTGNVFSPILIDKAIQLGEQYKNIPANDYTVHSIGIDPGFGSSRTAVVLTEFLKEEHVIRVLYAEEFEHSNPQDIVNLCFDLYRKHYNTWIWVDGANRAFVNLMKVAFSEPLSWESSSKNAANPEAWKILPVNFSTEHKNMLAHIHTLINKEYLAIPQQHEKLIICLRTSYAKEYSLDKEQTSYSDSLDALRLACKMYKMN